MSGIVLSSSVRQNLLSLQSTADLLATTQNRLATGKKVNTALDNPTNFFTAQSLDSARQRHQQPARRHRQRRAGAAGRQHRHHLAAEAGRHREVDRQPGAADHGRLLHQVERLRDDHRRHRDRPARHHELHQRDRVLQRAVLRRGRRHHRSRVGDDARRHSPLRWLALPLPTAPAPLPAFAIDPDSWHRCAQRHHHCGQRRADRRRDPDRQRQDHHLQVGLGSRPQRRFPPAPACSAISSPTATATPPSTSAPTDHPDGDGAGPARTRSISPAASRRPSIAAGVATISNSSGTNAADRRRRPHPARPVPALTSASPAGPIC